MFLVPRQELPHRGTVDDGAVSLTGTGGGGRLNRLGAAPTHAVCVVLVTSSIWEQRVNNMRVDGVEGVSNDDRCS